MDRLDGVLLVDDAKPGVLPVREDGVMYCSDNHLWVGSFTSGGYFCSNCAARIQDRFLRDFIELNKIGPRDIGNGYKAEAVLKLDDVFEAYLLKEREATSKDTFGEEYVEPRPTSRHSIILGTGSGGRRGSLWDRCTVDGREIYAARAKVDLHPNEIPTVELTVHAHHLKEYLDDAFLDLAVIQLDGTVIKIESVAFVPRGIGFLTAGPVDKTFFESKKRGGDDVDHSLGPGEHLHKCPECYEAKPCDYRCSFAFEEGGKDFGSHAVCGDCFVSKKPKKAGEVNVKINVDATEANKLIKEFEEKLRKELPKMMKTSLDRVPIRTGKLRRPVILPEHRLPKKGK